MAKQKNILSEQPEIEINTTTHPKEEIFETINKNPKDNLVGLLKSIDAGEEITEEERKEAWEILHHNMKETGEMYKGKFSEFKHGTLAKILFYDTPYIYLSNEISTNKPPFRDKDRKRGKKEARHIVNEAESSIPSERSIGLKEYIDNIDPQIISILKEYHIVPFAK